MPHPRTAAALVLCLLASSAPALADNGRPVDRQVEQFLIDIPTSQGIHDDLTRLNAQAHYPGTTADRDIAYWMRDRLTEYGFTAKVESFQAEVPQLQRAVLQLQETTPIDFDLKEGRIASDPDGSRGDAGTPFNAWGGSGDVTAQLAYVNRGTENDYLVLSKAQVPVRGKILLIRYGAEFRGSLARRAEEKGAAGVLFYDDPADGAGSANGAPYPDGPYRPMNSVQRGSLAAPQLHIPVQPVSAMVAQRLLQDVSGSTPPRAWRGRLSADYALGVTRAYVHLLVMQTPSLVTLWNTIGILPGTDTTHHVILGGHRDAWVYGVTDNGSGISTLLEAARALGYIYRSGWRPAYSVVIAGFDGEEVGEAGSNSYVRTHEQELRRGCIAYVNADENVTGNFFNAKAAAALAGMIPVTTRLLPDAHNHTTTVWENWRRQQGGVVIQAPGGGSDHEAFLYLVGIPTMDMGFAGPFGVYHSAYDDLQYATTQADPHLVTHRTMAQLLALMAYRMTLGGVPYDLNAYVGPMRDAYGRFASSNGTGADLRPLSSAIDRFAAQAQTSQANPADATRTIEAVRRLDLLFYGRGGYGSVAFPSLATAWYSGNASAVTNAITDTAAQIDNVTSVLANGAAE
ncbi:MAG: M28 family peptidase [Candidatus Eremiobacteraeota bacterium]|nr:M28 family peptidase [Candidatus Eremiobacteraeota bacterium]